MVKIRFQVLPRPYHIRPKYGTIILGAVQVLMTLVCVLIIEKAGRKLLLFVGFVGMCFEYSVQ